MDLKEGTIYRIRYKHYKNRVYTGTFKCFVKYTPNIMNANFTNVSTHYSRDICDELSFYNYSEYNYYDVYKMNNAKKAIENMEKRALDKILKRLVNEYFEW
jgi:hypothetical protein